MHYQEYHVLCVHFSSPLLKADDDVVGSVFKSNNMRPPADLRGLPAHVSDILNYHVMYLFYLHCHSRRH